MATRIVINVQTSSNCVKQHPLRIALGVVATAAAVGLLVPGLLRVAANAPADAVEGLPVEPARALLSATALAAAALLTWLVAAAALEAVGHLPGVVGRGAARLSAAVTPRLLRRAVGVALGLGVGVGVGAGPAPAAPTRVLAAAVQVSAREAVLAVGERGSPADRQTVGGPAVGGAGQGAPGPGLPDPGWSPPPDPGWTPDAPVVRPQPDVTAVTAASRRGTDQAPVEVVVHRGDSLWTITARHLGAGATDAEVAAQWPRWYSANRAVIGSDPDLLLPGQVLRAPEDDR